jgi:hypothetical protein
MMEQLVSGVLVGNEDADSIEETGGGGGCAFNLAGITLATCAQLEVLSGPLGCAPPFVEMPDTGAPEPYTYAAAWSPSQGITCGTVRSEISTNGSLGIISAGVWLGGSVPEEGFAALFVINAVVIQYFGITVASASATFVDGAEISLTVTAGGFATASYNGVALVSWGGPEPATPGLAGIVGETYGHNQTLAIEDCRCA